MSAELSKAITRTMALTAKQSSYVDYYTDASNKTTYNNSTQSMIAAGYAPKYAHTNVDRLTTNDYVKQAIADKKAKIAKQMGYSIEQYRLELESEISKASASGQHSAAITGIVAKGRSCGYDKDNQQGKTEQAQPLTSDERKALLQQARALDGIQLVKDTG